MYQEKAPATSNWLTPAYTGERRRGRQAERQPAGDVWLWISDLVFLLQAAFIQVARRRRSGRGGTENSRGPLSG